MRIAYDHQIFGWQEYGGISRYFFELANGIANTGAAEVAIISPFFINAYLAASSAHLQIRGRKMPPIRHTGRIYRAINQLFAPSIMRNFQPDLVHETYYSDHRLAPSGSKVVLTVFDMINELFPEDFSSWDSTSREKAIAVKRADHVICISQQTQNDLIKILGVDPQKTSVVHLGFSLTQPLAHAYQKSERPYLLYVGNRAGYKNFQTLLRAYASSPTLNNEYDLIAFGGGAFTIKEKALIAHNGICTDRVKQLGGDDALLSGLYRNATAFVYPSRYEGFGIPPLEAMSFDCPVVSSNTSSIPEVVGNAAEFFDPDSSESLMHAIENVLNNESLRQDLVARGRERIKLFSWEHCAEQTLNIYKELLV